MFTYKVDFDPEPINPAKDDGGWLTTIVSFHCRHNISTTDEFGDDIERFKEFMAEHPEITFHPLYMYDHSGITISTKPFSCRWDSGQVGWAYIDPKRIEEMFEYPLSEEEIAKHLELELETYDNYLQGNIYCYTVRNSNGDCVDSCSGFYDEEEAVRQAKDSVEWHEKNYVDCKGKLVEETVNKLVATSDSKEITEILLKYGEELEKLA